MYNLTLDENKRIILATYSKYVNDGTIVDTLPEGRLCDYLYINEEYVYSPIEEEKLVHINELDRIEAQLVYTAMMTDTLITGG